VAPLEVKAHKTRQDIIKAGCTIADVFLMSQPYQFHTSYNDSATTVIKIPRVPTGQEAVSGSELVM